MTAYLISIFAICGIYMILNFKHDIQMLQQNSYRIDRYWKWVQPNISSAWRLVDVALLFLLFSTLLNPLISAALIAITAIVKSIMILKKKSKKPLVFTKRVWRIYSVTAFISIAMYGLSIACAVTGISSAWWYVESDVAIPIGVLLITTTFSWAIVIISVVILSPVEKSINRKYWNEADHMLRSMPDLTIIGITGSFGKTSTKHYLTRILSEQFDVLMTPGSFNTPMGVIRTVREQLRPNHKIFVCEMGAKQKGDIKEICDLVHPEIGIITAVGPMHLESFRSIENVQGTKFELADSLPSDGLAVINNDFEYCANRNVNNVKAIRYTVNDRNDAQYFGRNISYSPQGTSFTVTGPDGYTIELTTRLVGECNISNLIGAVIVAKHLGVPDEKIRYAVSHIEQVEHRLNIKRTPGGINIIDDAFNSNPSGSKMAVDVLEGFSSGKRIIVTPGMIELGDKQFELNREFGTYIAGKADVVIVVGQYNREAILSGLKFPENAGKMKIIVVDSFDQAQQELSGIMTSGDTVLYENDLPDTFK